jgi:hypothetical protein
VRQRTARVPKSTPEKTGSETERHHDGQNRILDPRSKTLWRENIRSSDEIEAGKMKLQPENTTSDRGRAPAERHGKISSCNSPGRRTEKQKNGSRGKTQATKTNNTHSQQKPILSLKINKITINSRRSSTSLPHLIEIKIGSLLT